MALRLISALIGDSDESEYEVERILDFKTVKKVAKFHFVVKVG